MVKKAHSTAFDLITTFITKMFFLFGSFIISIILARLLGPEGKGMITALFVIPNTLVSLADLGIRQSAAYYIGRQKYSVQDIVSTSLMLWIITSAISVIVVLTYYLSPLSVKYATPLIIIAVAYIPVKILVAYFNGILQGMQKIANMNVKFFIQVSARLIFVLLFVWLLDMGVIGAALSMFVNMILVLIYSTYIVRKSSKLKVKYIDGVVQDIFRKGLIFAIGLFVIDLNYKFDLIFLENMVGPYELGIYSVGVTLAELILQVPSAINIVLFAKSANSKSDFEASERSARLLRLCWIPLVIGTIIFWMGAPFFAELLYGSEFVEAGGVIRVLLPGILFMVLLKILNTDMAGRGKPMFGTPYYLLSLFTNIALNLFLIPIYGIYGAGIASTISYFVGAVSFSIAYHRATHLRYRDLFILNSSDIEMIKSLVKKWKNKIR